MTGDLIGQILGNRYRFDKLIGQGTFAHVYRVYDLNRRAVLAAKVLRSDIAHEPTLLERFKREARALERLQHPNIVRYYDILDLGGNVFILMDYIPGETLQTALYRQDLPLPPRTALDYLTPLAAALHYAHSENIIHRDLKPGNILLHENGMLYVTDFGIARFLSEVSTLTLGSTIGTPLYMSPEQITGDPVTASSDLYALGVILYQMYTGQVPFRGDTADAEGTTAGHRVAYEHVHVDPAPLTQLNPDVSPAVEEVVLRSLQKEPAARYPSIAQMVDALTEAIGVPPVTLESGRMGPTPPDVTLPEWTSVAGPKNAQLDLESQAPIDEEDTDDLPNPPAVLPPTRPHLEQALRRQRQDQHPTIPSLKQAENSETPTLLPPYTPHYDPPVRGLGSPRSATRRWPYMLFAGGLAAVATLLCVGATLATIWWLGRDDTSASPTALSDSLTSIPVATVHTTRQPGGSQGGTRIAFDSRRDGDLALFVMNIDGTNLHKIETGLSTSRGPAWSPNGTQLAFYGTPEGDSSYDIFIVNLDGTGIRNITNTVGISDRYPTWSPNGTQIAYHSNLDGDNEIYVVSVDGTGRRQITDNTADDLGPDWSPDGALIAFHTDQWGSPYEIGVVNIATGEALRLTNTDDINSFPTWSPDGTRIAFHAIDPVDLAVNLYTMAADGTNIQPITSTHERDAFPDWSPDGTELVYQNGLEGVSGIFITPLGGAPPRAVTGRQMNYLPEWEPRYD